MLINSNTRAIEFYAILRIYLFLLAAIDVPVKIRHQREKLDF